MPRGTVPPNPQLVPLPIAVPGSQGLNLQQQFQVLPPQWCIEASNCIIDANGRIAARGGFTSVTTSAGSGVVRSIFEYINKTGVSQTIVAADGSLTSNVATPGDNALGGSVSVTNGRWYFQNFNGKVLGFQKGGNIIAYNGTGTFGLIGGSPTGGIGCAAYGRVWSLDADGQTVRWSALLDETNWTTGDSGSINMTSVWPKGIDTVKAIFAFNGTLVIAGVRQLVFYGSTDPTVLGLDVTQLLVVDVIEGTGCVSQWTVAPVGETDILFLSSIGIQSVARLLVQQSRPTTLLSKYVRDAMIAQLSVENTDNITGMYSPTNGFYALSLPVSQQTWIADQRHRWSDPDGDEVSRMTRWATAPTAMFEMFNRTVYMANRTGVVAKYIGGQDYGQDFTITLQLPWMDFGEQVSARLKALKRLGGIFYVRNDTTITFTWFVDFNAVGLSEQRPATGTSDAEWGSAQWAIDEWSGGLLLNIINVPGSGTGQYFSLSISAVTDSAFAAQQLNLLAKILRIA